MWVDTHGGWEQTKEQKPATGLRDLPEVDDAVFQAARAWCVPAGADAGARWGLDARLAVAWAHLTRHRIMRPVCRIETINGEKVVVGDLVRWFYARWDAEGYVYVVDEDQAAERIGDILGRPVTWAEIRAALLDGIPSPAMRDAIMIGMRWCLYPDGDVTDITAELEPSRRLAQRPRERGYFGSSMDDVIEDSAARRLAALLEKLATTEDEPMTKREARETARHERQAWRWMRKEAAAQGRGDPRKAMRGFGGLPPRERNGEVVIDLDRHPTREGMADSLDDIAGLSIPAGWVTPPRPAELVAVKVKREKITEGIYQLPIETKKKRRS